MEPEGPEKTKSKKPKKFYIYLIIFACFILIFSACKCPNIGYMGRYALDVITGKDTYIRVVDNPDWAEKLDLPGLPNLHKVSDDLYRGAQPTEEGMKQLEKLGIQTIVNLRSLHSNRDEMKDVNIPYEHIHMTTLDPDTDDIISFLKIVSDSNNTPVFVHCRHGADRTGTVCAIYRIIVQDWSKDEAIEEMKKGGFGFHSIWSNLPNFIRKLDIEEIKQKTGLIEQKETVTPLSIPD